MLAVALMRGRCTSTSPGTSVLSTANVILVAAVFYHSSSDVLIQRVINQLKYRCMTAEQTPESGISGRGVPAPHFGVKPHAGGQRLWPFPRLTARPWAVPHIHWRWTAKCEAQLLLTLAKGENSAA